MQEIDIGKSIVYSLVYFYSVVYVYFLPLKPLAPSSLPEISTAGEVDFASIFAFQVVQVEGNSEQGTESLKGEWCETHLSLPLANTCVSSALFPHFGHYLMHLVLSMLCR